MAKPNPEAIKLWFEFLRLSDRKKWTKQVAEDFGDVWAPDFDPLERGRWFRLFVDFADSPIPLAPYPIPERYLQDDDRYKVYVVDFSYPKAAILKAFRNRLDRHVFSREKKWGKGRPKHRTIKAKYTLCRRPNIPALQKILSVYTLRLENPNWKLYQIGEELRLNENQMPRKGDSPDQTSDKRRVMTATVARYIRQAEELIRNVEKGIFPLYK